MKAYWKNHPALRMILMLVLFVLALVLVVSGWKMTGQLAGLGIMLVGVAHVVDLHVIGTGDALRSAVVCFYLSNEGVSMLENAAHLGLPVPDKLKGILAQLHGRMDEQQEGDR